ncbi:hypothetical protein [Cohnella hashimotonis]|uniref:SGNH hydrolase-type esterase domain-containing protein n=1 Tax=Cohnella hashimotonis TaxID=2826895 RepID=A0ABT6TPH8_9BACL|nr:hypothetical protein [Cohnella hashimotonis]MDI4648754.1 hypothetical protein [Cohnella hashimotonis]
MCTKLCTCEWRELADSYSATFVPLQHLFDEACRRAAREHWLWDGIHPTAAGHELIARQWLKTVTLPGLQ